MHLCLTVVDFCKSSQLVNLLYSHGIQVPAGRPGVITNAKISSIYCHMMILLTITLVMISPALGLAKPVIVKKGTIDCDLVEATPVVFHGQLYRFECVRTRYKPNTTGRSYFRFVHVETDNPTPAFAAGYNLGCAIVDGDTVYVYGVKGWGSPNLYVFWSKDMKTWQSQVALKTDNWGLFNSSVCKHDKGYLMAFEIDRPQDVVGKPFTIRFAYSNNLLDWQILEEPAVYSKQFYTACPSIRYLDGYYYMFYLAGHLGPQWETDLVRSRDLVTWEKSPYNPVLAFSLKDKNIANESLSLEQRKHITKSLNRNNSDFDLCEFGGKVSIIYSWGDQNGTKFLAEAFHEGSMEHFLKGFFDEPLHEGNKTNKNISTSSAKFLPNGQKSCHKNDTLAPDASVAAGLENDCQSTNTETFPMLVVPNCKTAIKILVPIPMESDQWEKGVCELEEYGGSSAKVLGQCVKSVDEHGDHLLRKSSSYGGYSARRWKLRNSDVQDWYSIAADSI